MAWEPDYVLTEELAAYVTIGDTVDDVQLGLAVTAASSAVDRHTHRQFGNTEIAEVRRYTARWTRRRCAWVVRIDDLMDLTGMDVQVPDGAVTGFTLEPVNAGEEGRPYQRLVVDQDSTAKPTGVVGDVSITALWGWTAVPDTVKQATLLQASRLFTRRLAPFGVAGSPELGSEVRLLARVDPDVAVTLRKFVRDRVAVG